MQEQLKATRCGKKCHLCAIQVTKKPKPLEESENLPPIPVRSTSMQTSQMQKRTDLSQVQTKEVSNTNPARLQKRKPSIRPDSGASSSSSVATVSENMAEHIKITNVLESICIYCFSDVRKKSKNSNLKNSNQGHKCDTSTEAKVKNLHSVMKRLAITEQRK